MPGDINRELLMKKRAGGTYKHTGTETCQLSLLKRNSEKISSNGQYGSFESPNKLRDVNAIEQK